MNLPRAPFDLRLGGKARVFQAARARAVHHGADVGVLKDGVFLEHQVYHLFRQVVVVVLGVERIAEVVLQGFVARGHADGIAAGGQGDRRDKQGGEETLHGE
jgi:hypothetical protein